MGLGRRMPGSWKAQRRLKPSQEGRSGGRAHSPGEPELVVSSRRDGVGSCVVLSRRTEEVGFCSKRAGHKDAQEEAESPRRPGQGEAQERDGGGGLEVRGQEGGAWTPSDQGRSYAWAARGVRDSRGKTPVGQGPDSSTLSKGPVARAAWRAEGRLLKAAAWDLQGSP